MVLEDGHTIVNYFLFRNKPFETKGRYQTAEESDKIATALFDYLKERNLHPVILEGHDYERVIAILKHLSIIYDIIVIIYSFGILIFLLTINSELYIIIECYSY